MSYTRDQYRTAWNDATIKDPQIPLNVDIELSSVCNLKCPFCFRSDPAFKNPNKFMDSDMAIDIIDDAGKLGVPALKFNWRGEPTLHPDFSEILHYAYADRVHTIEECEALRKKGYSGYLGREVFHELLVNTNGNVPDRAFAGLMLASKVMISLDSMNPKTYAEMRRGGSLDRALDTIASLIRTGHKNVWVRRVINSTNREEHFVEDVRDRFGSDVKIAEHFEFFRADKSAACSERPRTYCGYPSQRIVIASDGKMFPCCVDYDETMPLGKYPSDSLYSVWKSASLNQIRSDLRAGIFKSDACKNCTSFMAYNVPERESVQDKEPAS